MEPLSPQVRKAILDANPNAQPEDIEEYERLLAERFRSPPDDEQPVGGPMLKESVAESSRQQLESRLAALHQKLFPGVKRQP